MRYFLLIVLLTISISTLESSEPRLNLKETEPSLVVLNELQRLDHLISATEENLTNQKNLKQLLLDYQQQQLKYLEHPQDKQITLQMVKSAHQLLNSIKAYNLVEVFDTEFVSQLSFFSQFATKRGIPKS